MSPAKLLLLGALRLALAFRELSPLVAESEWQEQGSLGRQQLEPASPQALAQVGRDEPSDEWAPSEQRLSFMKDKLKTDLRGAASGLMSQEIDPAPRGVQVPKGGVPKIAFIFLIMDGVDNEEVWEAFFAGARNDSYSIYTHRAKPGDGPNPLARLGSIPVPQVEQAWCALSGLEVSVLATALKDTANTQFVLLSQNAVPLKSFDYIYTRLAQESPQTSKICYASPAPKPGFFETQQYNEDHNECTFRDFYQAQDPMVHKHHQWVILARHHVHTFLQYSEEALQVYNDAWQKAAPDLWDSFEGCSDEAVVSTALLLDLNKRRRDEGSLKVTTKETWANDLMEIGIERSCTTWLRWRNCFIGTPMALAAGKFLRPMQEFIRVVQSGAYQEFFKKNSPEEQRKRFEDKKRTAINGVPHLFGPPAVEDFLKLRYLKHLVLEEGFLFGRKFNKGVLVKMKNSTKLTLVKVLPGLWREVDEAKTRKRIWKMLERAGAPDA